MNKGSGDTSYAWFLAHHFVAVWSREAQVLWAAIPSFAKQE